MLSLKAKQTSYKTSKNSYLSAQDNEKERRVFALWLKVIMKNGSETLVSFHTSRSFCS